MLDLRSLVGLDRPGVTHTEWNYAPDRDVIQYRLYNEGFPRNVGIQLEIGRGLMRFQPMSQLVDEVSRRIEVAAGLVYWLGATRYAGR